MNAKKANNTKTKKSVKSKVLWVAGTVAMTAAGFLIISPIMRKTTNAVYKSDNKADDIDIENMGPEIVKKEKEEEV